jgi:hypothetical protein
MRKKTPIKFVRNRKYRLVEDFNDVIYGLILKGTILRFDGSNLGYARFILSEKGISIAMKPKTAFRIIEEAD